MAIERINICVFGASSRDLEQRYVDDAYHLGTLIAQRGWACYNGAGCEGLMRAVSDGALDAGGEAIGVIPQFMVDNGWHYNRLTRIITTSDMHQRKLTLAQSTQAVIALPGGCGTLEELLEAITWRQLNLAPKPIVALNTLGYYDPLEAMLKRMREEGFLSAEWDGLVIIKSSPEELLSEMDRLMELYRHV